MQHEIRCIAKVADGGRSVGFHQCSRMATQERNGKPYCSTHDPEKVAEHRRQRREKLEAESKEKNALWEKERRTSRFIADVQAISEGSMPQWVTDLLNASEGAEPDEESSIVAFCRVAMQRINREL